MLEHWIQPLDNPVPNREYLTSDRLGVHISGASDQLKKTDRRDVALIGVDSRWSKLVRRHLYHFTHRMPDINIRDFGDMRRSDPEFMIGPLFELISGGVCPILIGTHISVVKAIAQSFQHLRLAFRPSIIAENVPEVISGIGESAFVIGVQQHLVPRNIPQHVHTLHLSEVRQSFADAEALIRQSNACVIDMSAISSYELPAQHSISASGFCTEEACMLMRYAGLHAGTRLVVMTGHDPRSLQLDSSANIAAQLIWYFLEGYNQCLPEDPLSSAHCTSYVVHLDLYDTGFKFYKSERTGRWWVQMHAQEPGKVFPCTYRDYQHATQGQVSDRLIQCANASLEGSKYSL
jgi:hypothetical protein